MLLPLECRKKVVRNIALFVKWELRRNIKQSGDKRRKINWRFLLFQCRHVAKYWEINTQKRAGCGQWPMKLLFQYSLLYDKIGIHKITCEIVEVVLTLSPPLTQTGTVKRCIHDNSWVLIHNSIEEQWGGSWLNTSVVTLTRQHNSFDTPLLICNHCTFTGDDNEQCYTEIGKFQAKHS